MKFHGCYEHSENNVCTLAYPTFTLNATTNHEITFTVQQPTLPTNRPAFDNSISDIVVPTSKIPFNHDASPSTTITMSSTFKTKPLEYVPTKVTSDSVRYDLRSAISTTIPPQSRKAINLGFNIAIPPGLYGRIVPRSDLAFKNNIDVAAGVIDPDYRGEVKVLLVNSSQKQFKITKGDKIA